MDGLRQKTYKLTTKWDLSVISQEKVDALEEKVQKEQDQMSSYIGQIFVYEVQIAHLTQQVEDLKKKEMNLETLVLT